jgi:hypothetical protein
MASASDPEINRILNADANPDGWINHEAAMIVRQFTDTIKGLTPELCPLEDAILSDTISHMGNIVIRTGRKVKWDPAVGTIPGDPEAWKIFDREQRAAWKAK